ncbi:MAG: diaminopimelate epimerase [Chitinophagales bacterium]|nr:diaminopimelate epimerase [Chitinophagales bacterium]
MNVNFAKYQATGNDFILIDDRIIHFPVHDNNLIQKLCHRRYGIGADGLILLQKKDGYDFGMMYFNSDGKESTMCGNGGRSIVHFAYYKGIVGQQCTFLAADGKHEGRVDDPWITISMKDVEKIITHEKDAYILDTGSPHYVLFCADATQEDLIKIAKAIRYSDTFAQQGINVNLVSVIKEGHLFVRTYERGVEDETLSCGTGVVAATLAYSYRTPLGANEINIDTRGGKLKVSFEYDTENKRYQNIMLSGPVEKVFEGNIEINSV